jgi:DNA-binding NtrC family response regulator
MNGFQLYKEIRKRESKAQICFLTASETIPDITKEFSSEYLIIKKPIENNYLIRIVNNLLNK